MPPSWPRHPRCCSDAAPRCLVPAFDGIDFDNPPEGYDFKGYFDAIKSDEGKPELWAFNGSLYIGKAREEFAKGDAEEALKSMHAATRCAAVIRTFGDVEDTLWRGYLWNLKVFEVSGVPLGDPAKIESLEVLANRLQSLRPVALHDLLQTSEIASKLEVPHLTESEITNVVTYVWETKKQDREESKESRRLRFDRQNMWAGAISAVLGAMIGALIGGAFA